MHSRGRPGPSPHQRRSDASNTAPVPNLGVGGQLPNSAYGILSQRIPISPPREMRHRSTSQYYPQTWQGPPATMNRFVMPAQSVYPYSNIRETADSYHQNFGPSMGGQSNPNQSSAIHRMNPRRIVRPNTWSPSSPLSYYRGSSTINNTHNAMMMMQRPGPPHEVINSFNPLNSMLGMARQVPSQSSPSSSYGSASSSGHQSYGSSHSYNPTYSPSYPSPHPGYFTSSHPGYSTSARSYTGESTGYHSMSQTSSGSITSSTGLSGYPISQTGSIIPTQYAPAERTPAFQPQFSPGVPNVSTSSMSTSMPVIRTLGFSKPPPTVQSTGVAEVVVLDEDESPVNEEEEEMDKDTTKRDQAAGSSLDGSSETDADSASSDADGESSAESVNSVSENKLFQLIGKGQKRDVQGNPLDSEPPFHHQLLAFRMSENQYSSGTDSDLEREKDCQLEKKLKLCHILESGDLLVNRKEWISATNNTPAATAQLVLEVPLADANVHEMCPKVVQSEGLDANGSEAKAEEDCHPMPAESSIHHLMEESATQLVPRIEHDPLKSMLAFTEGNLLCPTTATIEAEDVEMEIKTSLKNDEMEPDFIVKTEETVVNTEVKVEEGHNDVFMDEEDTNNSDDLKYLSHQSSPINNFEDLNISPTNLCSRDIILSGNEGRVDDKENEKGFDVTYMLEMQRKNMLYNPDGPGPYTLMAFMQRFTIPNSLFNPKDSEMVIFGFQPLAATFQTHLCFELDISDSEGVYLHRTHEIEQFMKNYDPESSKVKYMIYLMNCDSDETFRLSEFLTHAALLKPLIDPFDKVDFLLCKTRSAAGPNINLHGWRELTRKVGTRFTTCFYDAPVALQHQIQACRNKYLRLASLPPGY